MLMRDIMNIVKTNPLTENRFEAYHGTTASFRAFKAVNDETLKPLMTWVGDLP